MTANNRKRTKSRHSKRENRPGGDKPQLPDRKHACDTMACHRCCGLGRQKSCASLDAVMKGDNLTSDAMGYSFSPMDARLVVDANIVKNIGYRPVPLPSNHPARGQGVVPPEAGPSTPETGRATQPNSPGDPSTANSTASPPSHAETKGSLWCHERGPSVFDRITTLFAVPRFNPDELEDVYAPDFILDFDYPEHTLACCTPLPAAEPDEEQFLAGYELAAESAARGQSAFAAEIPVVVDRLALTREAVGSGVADRVPAWTLEWPGW